MTIPTNFPYAAGLLYQKQAARAAARRQSPRGQAGHLGGLVTARTYPNSQRPRLSNGRFAPEGKERQTAGTVRPRSDGRATRRRGGGSFATAPAGLLARLNDALAAGDLDEARRLCAELAAAS